MPRPFLLFCCLSMVLTGCSSAPEPADRPAHNEDTPECANYRGMMTAPMPPSAMEQLRLACEQSLAAQRL